MKQFLIILLGFIGLWVSPTRGAIKPAKDARSHFSAEFYRRTVVDLKKEDHTILVSPAAAQKLLTTVYKGTESQLADRILFDISIKHIDMKRLREESFNETGSKDYAFSPHLRRRQMLELAEIIDKNEVVKYFEEDFSGTNDFIHCENFIVTPAGIKPTAEYKEFAKNYFNTHVIDSSATEMDHIKEKFDDVLKNVENVEILSDIEVKTKIKDSYTLANGNINAVVEAQYYEDEDRQCIVLLLDDGLKLFVTVTDKPGEFHYFITQIMGRQLRVFENYNQDDWKKENVLVHLPPLKLENVNDLAVHFRAVSNSGLKQSLRDDAKLNEGLENWPENGLKIEHIWQRVAVDIGSEDKTDAVKGPHTKTFDGIGKNLFFAIYNDKSFYVMGHYIAAV